MSAPTSRDELLAQALAIEREAAARYDELADSMEMHNNRDVAALFRRMARIEAKHAERIVAELGDAPPPPPAPAPTAFEAPETVPHESMHYLMHPWHALQLALQAECRAQAFFAALADEADDDEVRRAAVELRNEEGAHVRLVLEWLERVPKPEPGWAADPDPPCYID